MRKSISHECFVNPSAHLFENSLMTNECLYHALKANYLCSVGNDLDAKAASILAEGISVSFFVSFGDLVSFTSNGNFLNNWKIHVIYAWVFDI